MVDNGMQTTTSILLAVAMMIVGLTGMTMHPAQVRADSGGPSGCPDQGQCTCNPATGVMTDHAMPAPFNRINNGCTESDAGSFAPLPGGSDNGGNSDSGNSNSDNSGNSNSDNSGNSNSDNSGDQSGG